MAKIPKNAIFDNNIKQMGIQEYIVMILVVVAIFFLARKFFFQKSMHDKGCDHCDVSGIEKSKQKIKA